MGWEKQEEEAALSPPASEAERPDGSGSALSDNARWGSAATGSDRPKTWTKFVSRNIDKIKSLLKFILRKVVCFFTFIRSNIKPLKMPWYLLSNV